MTTAAKVIAGIILLILALSASAGPISYESGASPEVVATATR